jgi:uncharacterized Zn finger protein
MLDERTLEALAGARSFARGVEYAAEGAVGRLEVAGDVVLATVHGSHSYRVRFCDGGASGRLEFSCSCPVGVEGAFCKHCVAVGLCWLREGRPARPRGEVWREHLLGLSPERLAEILLDHAREDPRLAERLDAIVLRATEGPVDLGAYRALLDRALTVHGYVSYNEVYSFFGGVDAAIDALAALHEDGHAREVVELAEHALRALDATSGHVDDSANGGAGLAVERLEALHLAACSDAHVDPADLAERLFSVALESDLGVWSNALGDYAEIFGDPGLERYRELVESAFAASEGREGHWLVTSLAEQLARQDGDVDRLVAIRSRDLKGDWGYLKVVEVLVEAGRSDEALLWAERGLCASEVHHNAALRDYVAKAYRASGRVADAVRLRVEQLEDTPSLATYQALKKDAEALGEWPQHRAAALAALRANGTAPRGESRWVRRDSSTLVEILMWEGDESAAWEAAHAGGCSASLWRALALARVRARPSDSVAVYRRIVAQSVEVTKNSGYEHAVELLIELEQALRPGSDVDAHAALVAEIRDVYRRKRNLVKLLDARWPASPTQASSRRA